jgi:uncharacterized protein GlcG (DUF336 family)
MASRVIETVSTSGVSLERARKVLRAGQQRAQEIGVAMNIALVDAGANLVAFEPMEGAWLAAHDRLPIAKIVNATAIGLDEAPNGYKDFDRGAAKKFLLDPNGIVGKKRAA